MTEIVNVINEYLSPIMMVMMLLTGIILTVRGRFLQARKFPVGVKTCFARVDKNTVKDEKGVSPFRAFCTAISGTVGTGNIVGVTTAIMTGGPGAVFWMWISAIFGMMTKFSENVLGIFYRTKDKDGYRGGPMYYIEKGLGKKKLAISFALFTLLAAVGYVMAQVNSISGTLAVSSVPEWVTGVVVVVVAALVIIGGIKRISKFASIVVPFMAIFLVIMALVIIIINGANIPNAFARIFEGAFSLEAVGGGVLGYGIIIAMRYGIARGVFSNEAGLGSATLAHSESNVKEPVKQGFWGLIEVFIDTIIICTLMALVVLTTGADNVVVDGNLLEGAAAAMWAFTKDLGIVGHVSFSIILPLFAFTTIVSWSFYGEKAAIYLFGKKSVMPFKIIILALTFVGAVVPVALVWSLSDTFNTLMAVPNLLALVLLSGQIVKIVKNYFDRQKGLDVEPMLSFDPEFNEQLKKEL